MSTVKIERFKLGEALVGRKEPVMEFVGLLRSPEGVDNLIRLTAPCVVTKKPYSVVVNERDYKNWLNGTLIQKAMPYLSKEDREFLVSGTSPEGWTKIFGEDEE